MSRNHSKSAFSLVELLVAVTIMLVLAGAVGVSVWQWVPKARVARAQSDVEALKAAISLYRADNFTVPTQRQGLEALVARPTLPPLPPHWREGGYLDSAVLPEDPWGGQYVYLCPGTRGEQFEILSYGSDGAPGGDGEAADISSSIGKAPGSGIP
ncbi:MAG: type II secretion system major pseudopilin GspG [Kiritimatiellae bacterium]|nr:type II secretion system major pseudopilin GspG [Kiritimatiellia bacterium]